MTTDLLHRAVTYALTCGECYTTDTIESDGRWEAAGLWGTRGWRANVTVHESVGEVVHVYCPDCTHHMAGGGER